jgi:hypothetical protein
LLVCKQNKENGNFWFNCRFLLLALVLSGSVLRIAVHPPPLRAQATQHNVLVGGRSGRFETDDPGSHPASV